VNDYIGVSGGYLGDFSYRTHTEFYPQYCDLDIDPDQIQGTTRHRFVTILSGADAHTQARIIEGILKKYPVDHFPEEQRAKKAKLREEFISVIQRLRGSSPIHKQDLRYSSDTVKRVLQDSETLLREHGATSALDRVHTTLHAHLLAVCAEEGISHPADADITALFKALREQHPAFAYSGARADDVTRIQRATATILDTLNPLRNRASAAHPNSDLLPPDEAMLAINLAKSLLSYVDTKLDRHKQSTGV
jgi:hypothetical protein